MTSDQLQALEAFCSNMPARARILYAPGGESAEEAGSREWLELRGFLVEAVEPGKDLRFLNPKRESHDGVWSGRALLAYSIEDAQRIVATFFQGMKPGTGVLFMIHSHSEPAFASMLKQNGFQILLQGKRRTEDDRIAVIARRI